MTRIHLQCAGCLAALAFVLALPPGFAQTQPVYAQSGASQTQTAPPASGQTAPPASGIWQPVSQPSPRSGDAQGSSASSPAPVAAGASSWSPGQGSFGAAGAFRPAAGAAGGSQLRNPAAASGTSSWVAGRDSFGSTVQHGGIWRDPAAFTSPGSAAGHSASRAAAPAALPDFAAPSFAVKPGLAPVPRARLSRGIPGRRFGLAPRAANPHGLPSRAHGSSFNHANRAVFPAGTRTHSDPLGHSASSRGSASQPSGFASPPPSGNDSGGSAVPSPAPPQ